MNANPTMLSEAIVKYLGAGSAASPRRDEQIIRDLFGIDASSALLAQIKNLLGELDRIEVNWNTHDLKSGGEFVRSTMKARHPELSNEALRALEWKFTFDWR